MSNFEIIAETVSDYIKQKVLGISIWGISRTVCLSDVHGFKIILNCLGDSVGTFSVSRLTHEISALVCHTLKARI